MEDERTPLEQLMTIFDEQRGLVSFGQLDTAGITRGFRSCDDTTT